MANTKRTECHYGDKKVVTVEHTGPASYATGGETLTALQLGLKYLDFVEVSGSESGAHWVVVRKSTPGPQTSVKLIWMTVATPAEVANATNLSARTVTIKAQGF